MTNQLYTRRDLITFAASYDRMALARQLGQTAYGGDRDYYEVLGYPTTIKFDDYLQRYMRQDIAGRIVDLPPQDTWKKPPLVTENDATDTPFAQAWGTLANRLHVWSVLSRADRLSGIGCYGALLIGVRGESGLDEAIEKGKGQDILYLRPFSEGRVSISTWDDDATSPRYGLPELYEIKLREDKPGQKVHWTRVIHVAENKLDSEVYGLPRLQRVYNRLDDLMKYIGGGAEAAWLNMRPGTLLSNREGYELPQDDDSKEERETEVRRYAHDPLRFLMMEGMTANQIGASEVPDVAGSFSVAISLISAASGIPQRVLTGSAQGELAAAEYDAKQWAGEVTYRQLNYAEPEILRPFIDRLIWYGALPLAPDGYDIGTLAGDGMRYWPAIIEMTEAERAEITLNRANAAKALAHTLTGEMPISSAEQRELLGYPAREVEPQTLATNAALAVAIQNWRSGAIDAGTLAEFAIAEWVEAME